MAETPSELQAEVEKLERKHLENPAGRYFVPLANAYRKLGELELAEARLREGLRKHPEYLSAHIVLGRVLADRGASVEAAEEFRYVLSVDPQNLIALRTLGELAMSEGRTEEAGRWYRELLGVDPMNDEARQALSELDARAPVEASAEAAEEDFESGAWWTRSVMESDAPEPVLEGVAHGAMDDWAGPIAELDQAPPAPEAGQPYAGEANGEFRIGGDPGTETLLELDAAAADEFSVEPVDGDDDVEFVTETIAELYARQGFHDRAADVYRELLRQRGPDAALERRLAEVERMAAGLPPLEESADLAVPADLAPEAAPADALPVLEDFDLGTFVDEVSFEPARGEAVAADDVAPVAGDVFANSFSVGFAGYGEEGDLPSAPAEVAASEPGHAEPAGGTVASLLGELLAWRAPRPSAAPVETDADEAAEIEVVAMDDVAGMPEAPAAEGTDSFSFDEYFGAADEREPEADLAPAAPEAAPAAAPAAAEEEEDLESFQTWLRSLKR